MKKTIMLVITVFIIAISSVAAEIECPPGCKAVYTCGDVEKGDLVFARAAFEGDGDGCWKCECPKSSSKKHDIEVLDLDDVTVRQNHEEALGVVVKNKGNYDEEEIIVSVKNCPETWKCSEAGILELLKGDEATVEIILLVPKDAELKGNKLLIKAENEDDTGIRDLNVFVIEECRTNLDCPVGKYCTQRKCVCEERWKCSEWSTCSDNEKTRTCEEVNNCGTTEQKPTRSEECESSSSGSSGSSSGSSSGNVVKVSRNNNGGNGDDGKDGGGEGSGMEGITGHATGGTETEGCSDFITSIRNWLFG